MNENPFQPGTPLGLRNATAHEALSRLARGVGLEGHPIYGARERLDAAGFKIGCIRATTLPGLAEEARVTAMEILKPEEWTQPLADLEQDKRLVRDVYENLVAIQTAQQSRTV